MRAAPRPPPRRAPARAGLWAAALAGSAALHAAALAALLWAAREGPPEPGLQEGVAVVFEDTASREGEAQGGQAPGPPPEEAAAPPPRPAETAPPQAQAALADPPAPTPPPAPEAAPTPPATDRAEAPPAAAQPLATEDAPASPAEEAPSVPPAPEPRDERQQAVPLPPPPAPQPPRPERLAAQAPPVPQPFAEGVRLNAGSAALPDPSAGARALGAVLPPSAAPGQRNAPPEYPAESRRRGEEGIVRLVLRVGPDGRVEAAEVAESSGFPALDRAAVEAARRWRYRPAMQAGIAVAGTLTTAVHFRLTGPDGR